MNIKNWHEEKTEEEVWRNQSNIISKGKFWSIFIPLISNLFNFINIKSKYEKFLYNFKILCLIIINYYYNI